MDFKESNPMREPKNSSLAHVKLKGSARKTSESQNLVADIIHLLNNEIPDIEKLKHDISLIDNICLLAENNDCKTEVNKKEIVTQVLIRLFPELNNERDLDLISKNIDSVVDLSKNVKKMSGVSKFFKSTKKWVFKKLA